MKELTVKGYYKHYLSIYGVLSVLIGSFPLLSKLLPGGWSGYLFPPLGDQSPLVRVATLILGALVTLVVYFSKDHLASINRNGRIWTLFATITLSLIGLVSFFILSQRFVRSIMIPSKSTEIIVSVGYERTEFAQKNFGAATDWELLRYRGLNEEEVQRLWTPQSIIIARLGLFVSYLVFLMSAVASSSLGVLLEALRHGAQLYRQVDNSGDVPRAAGSRVELLGPPPTSTIELFYSYSHKDEDIRAQLENHLRLLNRQGVIAGWHDRRIAPGTEWESEILNHVNSARIILLVISADFLASDYCYDEEMTRALERHASGAARVIPVIVRACDWTHARFGKLQALPKDGEPIMSWTNIDEALTDVAKGIRAVASELRANDL